VNGKFSKKQKEVYEIVLEANKEAIKECVVGSNINRVHMRACEVLSTGLVKLGVIDDAVEAMENGRFFKCYMHNTSHWLGMDVHDVGYYGPKDDPISFVEGMILTVEPGLYFNPDYAEEKTEYDGIGIRIEDDILISKEGPVNLSEKIPKEIEEIENLMK